MKGQKTIKIEFTKRNSVQGERRVRSENCSEAEELQLLGRKYLQILYQISKPETVTIGFKLWSHFHLPELDFFFFLDKKFRWKNQGR